MDIGIDHIGGGRRTRGQLIAWGIVLLGVALRVGVYAWNTGFWYDEGWLIQNVQDKSFMDLVGPLANDQAAPLLYVWMT